MVENNKIYKCPYSHGCTDRLSNDVIVKEDGKYDCKYITKGLGCVVIEQLNLMEQERSLLEQLLKNFDIPGAL